MTDWAWCPDCDGHGVAAVRVGEHRHLGPCRGCAGTGRTDAAQVNHRPAVTEAMRETCRGKCSYPTRAVASEVLTVLRKREAQVGSFYRCRICRMFHLTSRPKNKRRRRQHELDGGVVQDGACGGV
jgi:hypothetical protein